MGLRRAIEQVALNESLRTTSINFSKSKDPKRALQHAKQLAKKYKIEVNPKDLKPKKKGDVMFRGGAKNLITFVKKQQEFLSRMAFSESLEESPINEDGHKDVSSMKTKVKTAMMALQKMNTELSKLPDDGDLPTWWTNKVAVAVDKLDGMADYLDTQVENLEESPLNTQSISGLKVMADRMVKKLSGEGLQRRVQLMTQIGKILGISVKVLPNGKIELK